MSAACASSLDSSRHSLSPLTSEFGSVPRAYLARVRARVRVSVRVRVRVRQRVSGAARVRQALRVLPYA